MQAVEEASAVDSSEMPKGVEHNHEAKYYDSLLGVDSSEMPKGVEHPNDPRLSAATEFLPEKEKVREEKHHPLIRRRTPSLRHLSQSV